MMVLVEIESRKAGSRDYVLRSGMVDFLKFLAHTLRVLYACLQIHIERDVNTYPVRRRIYDCKHEKNFEIVKTFPF